MYPFNQAVFLQVVDQPRDVARADVEVLGDLAQGN